MARRRKAAQLEVRRRVTIAGRVTAEGRPVEGAEVRIADAPPTYERWLRAHASVRGRREEDVARPERTETERDGHFRFLDLPRGTYTLTASVPTLRGRYGIARATVRVRRREGAVDVAATELALPPTSIEGVVTDTASEPVPLAEVRVAGGPSTRTGLDGRYALVGVEPGTVRVAASARGFSPAEQRVTVKAGATRTADFRLSPA